MAGSQSDLTWGEGRDFPDQQSSDPGQVGEGREGSKVSALVTRA